ncbi:Hsp20/alpha crystallin family protein [Sulfurimonas paralvinellae]|uniref:Hsp20/alpha crystallin family protein n=1 Tax=Sulfurimonas paralvinellae TaxID=317658 RepID=A0A7M1B5N4_9BACT|nr:Hsp20/alpha crystallin family protein [Sulfurimonas paralvinellae]QOP44955.1 Hsp20/alpha crystallin family protein [Sulfurimonas paralvinellae]
MKKILLSLFTAALLGSAANAANNVTDPYDADFAQMNKYFNSLIESHLTSAKLNNIGYPRMDIVDSAKQITIKFDLAGVNKENIKLSIDNDKILTLQGEKRESKEAKSKDYVKKEIFYGSFQKQIQLPDNIDESKLSTKFENGILSITIPKTEIKKPKVKVIPIK